QRGWEYTAQITRALDHLHSHNVMHRDLKPANILVNQDGTIRLGDFGLSREINEDYYLTIAGTKVYMAPEVHLLKRMNKSSDMFSLGVIIFQLITGHHPYQADSEEAMIDKIKKNKVSELPDWVSNQMKEVIKWMMNNNENHRPTTKMILSHDTVLMYLRSCEDRYQQKQEKIEALNERDLLIEERNVLQNDNERALAERDRERIENDRLQIERDRERIEKDRLQIERDRERIEKDRLQIEMNRERIEKDREKIEKERFKYERDEEKRRAETTQSELDKQKTKTNESQELVKEFQQQIETTQSDNIRLTTEVQNLKTEPSKLRPQTTSSNQQSKPEPKVQQIQQQVPPSLNPNMLIGIIPDKEHANQEGIKIIRTNKQGCSTVAFNPIISSGIVRFGGFFEDPSYNPEFIIGIADSSAVFGSNQWPFSGENEMKTICYWNEFENVQYSSAKGISNGKVFEWGKEWKKE
ncbi:MAG: putative kinase family protein, partial [Streblomastix strix]